MILRLVDAWQGYTKRHPVVVMLTLALLFTLGVKMIHAADSAYDNNNEAMPGTLILTFIVLHLGSTSINHEGKINAPHLLRFADIGYRSDSLLAAKRRATAGTNTARRAFRYPERSR